MDEKEFKTLSEGFENILGKLKPNQKEPEPKQQKKKNKNRLQEVALRIMETNKPLDHLIIRYLDLSEENTVSFKDCEYKVPKHRVSHYEPTFWDFGARYGLWLERHNFWKKVLDPFKIVRKRTPYPVGFLYNMGTPEPLDLEAEKKKLLGNVDLNEDWAHGNWLIEHNQVFDSAFNVDLKNVFRKGESNINWTWLIIMGIVAFVVVAVAFFVTQSTEPAQAITNATVTPMPTGGIIIR